MADLQRPTIASPRWPVGSTRSVLFAFGLVLAHLVVMFGFGLLVMLALGLDPREIADAAPLAYVALVITGGLDVAIVFVGLMRGVGRLYFHDVGWSRFVPRDLAIGVAGGALCIGVAFCVMIARSGSIDGAIERIVAALTEFTVNERVFCTLLGCVAAFTEETVFRGVMQPALQRRLGRWGGLVVTALVFAAYHFRFAPSIFLGKLGIGLVLGGVRETTGTLWASAIAHVMIWAVLCTA